MTAPDRDATAPRAGATLLAFLTTGCASCRPVWAMLASAALRHDLGALGARLVVVTPSRSMEDEQRARGLAPPGADLHMGSETWFAYGVARAGTVVLVRDPPGGEPCGQPGRVLGSALVDEGTDLTAMVAGWQRSQAPA